MNPPDKQYRNCSLPCSITLPHVRGSWWWLTKVVMNYYKFPLLLTSTGKRSGIIRWLVLEMTAKPAYTSLIKFKMFEELGHELRPESKIVDFGCGDGKAVRELRSLGYHAYGCDITIDNAIYQMARFESHQDIIRQTRMQPYRLPFEDNAFDFIISDQVFEHVQNYPEVVSELSRVLKADGCRPAHISILVSIDWASCICAMRNCYSVL